MVAILGIDISKRKFDAVLLYEGKQRHKVFPNQQEGFDKLQAWLNKQGVQQVHSCMEVTGTYAEALAGYLYEAGHLVSLVNPARIKAFGMSQLMRNKTDKIDAHLIALFCQTQKPEPWTPPSPEVRELQTLVRRLDALMQMRQQEVNRLHAGVKSAPVTASMHAVIACLDREIQTIQDLIQNHMHQHPALKAQQDLLTSIPGIAELTATKLLAEIPNLSTYHSARQVAAYAGLTPRQRVSGTSVRGKPCLSKTGNANVRKALYMPAVVAIRFNPLIRTFSERLRQKGKHSMSIIGSVMRKLLHIAYGVLKTGIPFDPNYLSVS